MCRQPSPAQSLAARLLGILLAGCCLLAPAGAAPASALVGGVAFEHAKAPAFGNVSMALAEDAAGFIWVGTQGGLVRWDGYLERRYLADPAREDALPDTYVRALHVDAAGALWVGTNAGGLARRDPRSERLERIPDPDTVLGKEVAALADRSAQSLWVAGSRGLAWLDLATRRLHREPLPADVGPVRALQVGRDGSLWVAGEGGLWRRRAPGAAFEPFALPTRDGKPPRVSCLFQDSRGTLWVGTRLQGAYQVAPGAGSGQRVRELGADNLSSDTVQAITEARPGEVWIGTAGKGILRIDVASGHTLRERYQASRPTSLVDDSVGALLRSRSGLVWVATNYALSRHDPRQNFADALDGGPGRPVRSDNVAAVLGLDDGRIWLSTGEYGAQVLDPVTGSVTELRPDVKRPETALPKARVIALEQLPGDEVWIGTQGGLYRARRDGSALRRVQLPGTKPDAEFWAFAQHAGTLWIGGAHGLWSLDLSAPRQPLAAQRHELPAHASVISLLADDSGLWVGTHDGLGHLAPGGAAVVMLPADPRDPTALTGGTTSSLAFDRRGRLWVGSYGGGLQVADGRRADGSLRFRRIGLAEGLPHNGVNAFAIDRDGYIWASTDDGIARVDPATLAVRAFGGGQVGLTTFYSRAASTLPGGELLFGAQGGLLLLHPGRVGDELPPPPTPVVTEASVGGRIVPASAVRADGGLVLQASNRSLLVEFASLAYAGRDELRYQYRLQGFDTDWVDAPTQRRLASYTNLGPGAYELQVRTARQHGAWSKPLTIGVSAQARWHEQPAAHAAFAALGLALLFAIAQLRTVVLRRQRARLEALVAQRTDELQKRSEELRASQAQLEQMAFSDVLTGLANRRHFNDELRRAVAVMQRSGVGFAVALIDLDRFKQVNDELGHDAGDAVLVAAAQRLCAAVRTVDSVARLGGDEFVVLLRLIDDEPAADQAVCGRIVAAMAQPIPLPGGRLAGIGCSVGLAHGPADGNDAETLLKAADTALYEAKRAGRGQWRRWQPQLAAAPVVDAKAQPADVGA